MSSNSYDGIFPMKCLFLFVCLIYLPLIISSISILTYIGFGIYFFTNDIWESMY